MVSSRRRLAIIALGLLAVLVQGYKPTHAGIRVQADSATAEPEATASSSFVGKVSRASSGKVSSEPEGSAEDPPADVGESQEHSGSSPPGRRPADESEDNVGTAADTIASLQGYYEEKVKPSPDSDHVVGTRVARCGPVRLLMRTFVLAIVMGRTCADALSVNMTGAQRVDEPGGSMVRWQWNFRDNQPPPFEQWVRATNGLGHTMSWLPGEVGSAEFLGIECEVMGSDLRPSCGHGRQPVVPGDGEGRHGIMQFRNAVTGVVHTIHNVYNV